VLEHVTVTRYVTPLREGGSLPALVEADNLGTYVMKFRGAGQGPLALVAEIIAGELARRLGLRVPELVLAGLDPRIGVAADFFSPERPGFLALRLPRASPDGAMARMRRSEKKLDLAQRPNHPDPRRRHLTVKLAPDDLYRVDAGGHAACAETGLVVYEQGGLRGHP
jgi:hypothetical protein